jgi:acetoacetate decarboxylase
MSKGFSVPLSATGASSTAPNPPWHYVGDYLAIEFGVDPDAVAELLPPGMEMGEGAGDCAVFFSDCQFATDTGEEIFEPAVSQYRECLVVAKAMFDGKPAAFMPYIFVDNDNSMIRGLIQGMPKQMGSIRMTRAFAVQSPAAAFVGEGGRFGASLSHRDRRLADARVILRQTTERAPNRMMARLINRRHFPSLEAAHHDRPLLDQMVRQRTRDVRISEIWTGDASLDFFQSPTHEFGRLRPRRVGAGYRYSFAMTIDDLTVLADLAG